MLADEDITLVGPEADSRNVRLVIEPVSSLPRVSGDRIQLQQALLNLLLNAMDAMNDSASDAYVLECAIKQREPLFTLDKKLKALCYAAIMKLEKKILLIVFTLCKYNILDNRKEPQQPLKA